MACIKSGKSLCALLVVGAWLATVGLAHAQDQTLEGTLSNTHCGLKHSTPDPKAAACVNSCISVHNAKYALVVGDKVYALEGGETTQYQKLAGLATKVTGHVDGMTVHVTSVSPGSGKPAEGSGMGCTM
jgi:hypothetical protein